MSGFIQCEDRFQATLFPEGLDDYVAEDSACRVIDISLDDLDLSGLGLRPRPTIRDDQPTIHAQAVCVRLSQPGSVEPQVRTGSPEQC